MKEPRPHHMIFDRPDNRIKLLEELVREAIQYVEWEEFTDNKKFEQTLRAAKAYLEDPTKENGFNHLDLERWVPSEVTDNEFEYAPARAAAFMPYYPLGGQRYAFYVMLDENRALLNNWLKERKLV